MTNKFRKLILPICLFLYLFTNLSFAGTLEEDIVEVGYSKIVLVKDKKAIVKFVNTDAEVGFNFFVLEGESSNNKIALLRVLKISKDMAQCEILKGSPVAGQKIIPSPRNKKSSNLEKNNESPNSKNASSTNRYTGLLFTYGKPVFAVREYDINSNEEDISMSGSAFKLTYFYENSFTHFLSNQNIGYSPNSLRAGANIQKLSVKGTSKNLVCDSQSSTNCNLQVLLLSVNADYKRMFSENAYLKIGPEIAYPITKKSTAIVVENLGINSSINLGLGYMFKKNKTAYPLELGMGYHIVSSDVKFTDFFLSFGFTLN